MLSSAFLAIVIFLPPEGRITVPLHDAVDRLLGRAAFVLPVALACVGMVAVGRSLRPHLPVPTRRLTGAGVLLLAVLVAEHLLERNQRGAGSIGEWLSGLAVDLLGTVLTTVLVLLGLIAGTLLVFDIRPRLPNRPPSQQQLQAEADATG